MQNAKCEKRNTAGQASTCGAPSSSPSVPMAGVRSVLSFSGKKWHSSLLAYEKFVGFALAFERAFKF